MKRPRTVITILFILLMAIVGLNYVRVSLQRAAAAPKPSLTPDRDEAPVRVYGRVEPRGREAFVGPLQPRRVNRCFVGEGEEVTAGQPLCELEATVEKQAFQVAAARVNELRARLDIIRDELQRKQKLAPAEAIPEFELSQKILEEKLLLTQISTAESEVELKRRELETYTLRSPIDGYLYKFDVRLGELLTPQDDQRIVIGKREKQVRLFIESFWLGKVHVGDRLLVHDAETLSSLGEGEIVAVSEYVGTRDFRTEDALERFDTKYAQAILQLEDAAPIPLGKLVVCERRDAQHDSEVGQRP